jgi:hypothetical protein
MPCGFVWLLRKLGNYGFECKLELGLRCGLNQAKKETTTAWIGWEVRSAMVAWVRTEKKKKKKLKQKRKKTKWEKDGLFGWVSWLMLMKVVLLVQAFSNSSSWDLKKKKKIPKNVYFLLSFLN